MNKIFTYLVKLQRITENYSKLQQITANYRELQRNNIIN